MSYCGRGRPRPNSNKMIWHDFYVILWAHPEVPGSIPTLDISFLFSSQTAPMWLIFLFANFNDTIQSKLDSSKENGNSKKQITSEIWGISVITRDQTGGYWITCRTSYQRAIVAVIPIISFDMTFTKPLNGSNSSKNSVYPSLVLVYPILLASR